MMKTIRSKDFTADRAWGSLPIANLDGTTVKLHWTDQPYKWHINDGQEVFAVMDGVVDMHFRVNGLEEVTALSAGDIFYADVGTEHVAHPRGAARVLVIEKEGSIPINMIDFNNITEKRKYPYDFIYYMDESQTIGAYFDLIPENNLPVYNKIFFDRGFSVNRLSQENF